MAFKLEKLLTDVFRPEAGEVVTVACDLPRPGIEDTPAWAGRRQMAREWLEAFQSLGARVGFTVNPPLTYPATGSHNAQLPHGALLGDREVDFEVALLGSTLAAFLTEFSATAPLSALCLRKEDFRAASMPGIEKRMEQSALSVDHRELARRCRVLLDLLREAERVEVTFSTGHHCVFDVRFRTPEMDDGFLPRHKAGDHIINLPSGETFIVPYEGELTGFPSNTEGRIPVKRGEELPVLVVAGNRITGVDGGGPEAEALRAFFGADPARTNIAEVAFGCNDRAQVTGNLLEDEKAGFHWAFGRSEHLGGIVGPEAFAGPDTVVHYDIVYAPGNPIQVAEAVVVKQGKSTVVLRDGAYLVFGKRR
ncbi:MAG: leucyl aminopeptidase [Acidobacteria bacterium]|nr:leucyl aminopeptidase [Acidobacteriota bacterium]